jgi:hypothetical protein
LHEGYEGGSDETHPILPTINLENFAAYKTPEKAYKIVKSKRSHEFISEALHGLNKDIMIDVAYYNPTIANAVLEASQKSKMVGIIRNCYDFVRSASFLEGEDIMAVGWPDPQKVQTPREKFISMGRLRPLSKTSEYDLWKNWGTIKRNIWLWSTTNKLLLETKRLFPDRVSLLRFELLKEDPQSFWRQLLDAMDISYSLDTLIRLRDSKTSKNKKKTGYQIGELFTWTSEQKSLMENSQRQIDTLWKEIYDRPN